ARRALKRRSYAHHRRSRQCRDDGRSRQRRPAHLSHHESGAVHCGRGKREAIHLKTWRIIARYISDYSGHARSSSTERNDWRRPSSEGGPLKLIWTMNESSKVRKLLIATQHRLDLWVAPDWFGERIQTAFPQLEVERVTRYDGIEKELEDAEILFSQSLRPEQ